VKRSDDENNANNNVYDDADKLGKSSSIENN